MIMNKLMLGVILPIFMLACTESKQDNKDQSESKEDTAYAKPETVQKVAEATIDYSKYTDSVFIRSKNFEDMYETDTVIFSSSISTVYLAGTMPLPSTHNQLDARAFDVCLVGLSSGECENTIDAREGQAYSYISKVSEKNDTIYVTVETIDYCNYSFLGDIGIENDTTLDIIYHAYGPSHSACYCEHTLHYKIATNCLLGDGKSSKLKSFVLNGSKRQVARQK